MPMKPRLIGAPEARGCGASCQSNPGKGRRCGTCAVAPAIERARLRGRSNCDAMEPSAEPSTPQCITAMKNQLASDVERRGGERHQRHEADPPSLRRASMIAATGRSRLAQARSSMPMNSTGYAATARSPPAAPVADDLPADAPVDQVEDKARRRVASAWAPANGCDARPSRLPAPSSAGEDAGHAVRDQRLQSDEQHQAWENQGDGRQSAAPGRHRRRGNRRRPRRTGR